MFSSKKYGPWAVILGASEGVGVSFARKLAKVGINVVLIARNEDLLDKVASQVRAESSVQTRTLGLDLTAPNMLAKIREVTDDIEVGLVVYNAGASHNMQPFLSAPLEFSLKLISLNPVGQVSVSHHFGTKMVARGRGGIILIGSLAGNAGSPSVIAYGGAKAFTQIFAEGLWYELRPQGVDVLCVVLGATDTPARTRLNLTDQPGSIVSNPDDVAQESLDALADGPVYVAKHLAEGFRQLCSLPRREAVEAMGNLVGTFRRRG
jgi:uncharacterized protein